MRPNHRLVALPWLLALCACAAFGQEPTDPAAERTPPAFEVPPAQEGVTYRRFIALGDHGSGRPDQRRIARAMAQRAAADGLDLIVTLGDNFYPAGVRSADDPQWKSKWEQVYADPALQVPCYPSLGNHDHMGSPQAQLDYAREHPNWRLPARYHTFTVALDEQAAQFFVLDTTPLTQGKDPEQLAWLEAELTRSAARWKVVYGHHPLYSHSVRPYGQALIAALEPLFVRHRVDLYMAGHDHTLEMLKPIQGVHYLISGAGAGPDWAYAVRWTDRAYYAATLGGFVLGRLSRDELVLEFVRPDGRTQYAHVLTKGRSGPF